MNNYDSNYRIYLPWKNSQIETLLIGILVLFCGIASIFSHWILLSMITVAVLSLLFLIKRISWIFILFILVPLLPILPQQIHAICLWIFPLLPFGVWGLHFISSGFEYVRIPRALFLFNFLFIFLAFISSLYAVDMHVSILEVIRYFSMFIFLFSLFQYIKSENELLTMIKMIIISTFLMALISIPDIISMNLTDIIMGDISKNRLSSFHKNPNNYAIPFLFSIPALFTMVMHPDKINKPGKLSIWLKCLLAGIFIYIVLLTNSRSALLCLMVSLSIILSTTKGGRQLLLIGGGCIICIIPFIWNFLYFALRLQRGLSGRDLLWNAALKIIQNSPWLGVGPGNFEIVKAKYILPKDFLSQLTRSIHVSGAAHNIYLSISAEIGLLAAVLLIVFLIYSLIRNIRLLRVSETGIRKQLLIISISILSGFIVRSLFETGIIIGSGWIGDNLYYFSVISIIYILSNEKRYGNSTGK